MSEVSVHSEISVILHLSNSTISRGIVTILKYAYSHSIIQQPPNPTFRHNFFVRAPRSVGLEGADIVIAVITCWKANRAH